MDKNEAIVEVNSLARALNRRGTEFRRLEKYKGECPVPRAIRSARVTNAYRNLMEFAETNYGKLIVRAATSRMRVGGIRTGNEALDKRLWEVWHANKMRGESNLAHDVVLTHGRIFAIVWPDETDEPVITLENPDTVIVRYVEGSRYKRVSALRRWRDDDGNIQANLYTPDAIWKFTQSSAPGNKDGWSPRAARLADGSPEPFPLPNEYEVVPVVEIATNRTTECGPYGHAEGDFEGNTGLIDRILVLDFLRLVIAMTSGFPIRAVIGDDIQYAQDEDGTNKLDDAGKPIPLPPFEIAADIIAQFENPDTKLMQLDAGDLKSFGDAIDRDIEQLAGLTRTPSYYMRSIPIQNVSADAIRASDAPLVGRIEEHKPNVGEGWQEVLSVAAKIKGLEVPNTAEVVWVDQESHSLSERADAATKLATVLPWDAVCEYALDVDMETIKRWQVEKQAQDLLDSLLVPNPADNGAAQQQ